VGKGKQIEPSKSVGRCAWRDSGGQESISKKKKNKGMRQTHKTSATLGKLRLWVLRKGISISLGKTCLMDSCPCSHPLPLSIDWLIRFYLQSTHANS
jgi:hypothetical protein